MKKSNILIAVFAVVLAAISTAKAEVAVKKMVELPQYPGIAPVSNSEYQFPTEDCCGHKVPKGTCMMVCFNDQLEWQPEEWSRISGITKSEPEPGTMGNLAGTSDKISSIDMDKNFSEAGSLLDGFYSGSKAKGGSDSSVVYAEQGNSQKSSGLTEKEICNAKPLKTVLLAKVPPLKDTPGKSSAPIGAPLGAGFIAAGTLALGLAGRGAGISKETSVAAGAISGAATGAIVGAVASGGAGALPGAVIGGIAGGLGAAVSNVVEIIIDQLDD